MTQPTPTGVEVMALFPYVNLVTEVYPSATAWAIDTTGSLTIQGPGQGVNLTPLAIYPAAHWFRVKLVSSAVTSTQVIPTAAKSS